MTRTLAVEWGPYQVRVCGLVPGMIEGTEGFARLGDLDNLNNKEKANASFDKLKEGKQKYELRMVVPL